MSLPEGVNRYALIVEYNGASFQGFQRQASARTTVQGALEQALTRIAASPVTLVCAGRTDAGVHACQQVVHFDTAAERPLRAWVEGANTHLPATVRIHQAQQVAPEFHARFSAHSRTYRYLTYSGRVRPAILGECVTWVPYSLDCAAMQDAAKHLCGEHNFTSFRASQCQASSPVRTIEHIEFTQCGAFVVMEIKANAFLHHMVRNIMGSLYLVGRGSRPGEWIAQLLAAQDRSAAAATAPPFGLYFVGVEYPPQLNFSVPARGPHFLPCE